MTYSLLDLNLSEFMDKAKDTSSIPGGGAICALNGALAASLSIMVYTLSSSEIETEYRKSQILKLEELFICLKKNIDLDSVAFDGVLKAFKLPKTSPEEIKYRSQVIQKEYMNAIEVPLSTMKYSLDLLYILKDLSIEASEHALTDVAIAADLIKGTLDGSCITIKLNLKSIKNREDKNKIIEKLQKIELSSYILINGVKKEVKTRLFVDK